MKYVVMNIAAVLDWTIYLALQLLPILQRQVFFQNTKRLQFIEKSVV